MKMTSVRGVVLTLVALAMSALPAFANIITSANAKDNCTEYQLNISGILLTPPTSTVSYTIVLTPSSGTAITINDSLGVTKTNSNGDFKGSTIQMWSKYGLTLSGIYTLSGTAHLNTSDGNTVSIAFSPNPLNCTLPPTLTTANSSITCSGFTLNVGGINLTAPSTVAYTIVLTPISGPTITVTGTIPVTPTNGSFTASISGTWPMQPDGSYTATGTAKLQATGGNSLAITFSPTTLSCTLTATATATDSCQQYTITVLGTDQLTSSVKVAYTITLTPTSGSPIVVNDSFTIPVTGGAYSGSNTKTWASYGDTLNTNYTLAGSATVTAGTVTQTASITFTPPTLACSTPPPACLPSSSLSVLTQGKTVTSYAPDGNWASGTKNIQVVGLEPPATGVPITTPNVVNSCSSNSVTGQTVCVANNTDVYLLTGTSLNTTLTSGSNSLASFSGGLCKNCGIAMNPATNTAAITLGLKSAPSGSGLQYLNLATNAFSTPVPADHEVSEDIVWDSTRNLILSPNEEGYYEIFQTPSTGTTEYSNNLQFGDGDSAAEDCTTGIAMSSLEYTDRIYITDLTQATYTAGNPGTWTAPGQILTLPEFAYWGQSGVTGISVAPTSHLAIVTSEFTGRGVGVLELPSTSGTGTPTLVDYASAQMPNTPDGNTWHEAWDPHAVTAYVSPNNGKAYGVMADAAPPNYIAIVDLQALLSAPRTPGTHTVEPTYDLVANGVVSYVAAH